MEANASVYNPTKQMLCRTENSLAEKNLISILTWVRCKKSFSSIPTIYKGQISKSIALFKGKRSVKKFSPRSSASMEAADSFCGIYFTEL